MLPLAGISCPALRPRRPAWQLTKRASCRRRANAQGADLCCSLSSPVTHARFDIFYVLKPVPRRSAGATRQGTKGFSTEDQGSRESIEGSWIGIGRPSSYASLLSTGLEVGWEPQDMGFWTEVGDSRDIDQNDGPSIPKMALPCRIDAMHRPSRFFKTRSCCTSTQASQTWTIVHADQSFLAPAPCRQGRGFSRTHNQRGGIPRLREKAVRHRYLPLITAQHCMAESWDDSGRPASSHNPRISPDNREMPEALTGLALRPLRQVPRRLWWTLMIP